jgi:hypothetical protein
MVLHFLSRSLRAGMLLLLPFMLATLACAGILFCAWQGSIIGVALSALVPGSCAVLMLTAGQFPKV